MCEQTLPSVWCRRCSSNGASTSPLRSRRRTWTRRSACPATSSLFTWYLFESHPPWLNWTWKTCSEHQVRREPLLQPWVRDPPDEEGGGRHHLRPRPLLSLCPHRLHPLLHLSWCLGRPNLHHHVHAPDNVSHNPRSEHPKSQTSTSGQPWSAPTERCCRRSATSPSSTSASWSTWD